MKKWPTSGWGHAGIAFVSASVLSAVIGYLTDRSVLVQNIRTAPQYGETGWNSLGAFAGGLVAALWTFPIAFILIFAIQRIFAAERNVDTSTDKRPPNDTQ
jgi:Na+/proline symporter